MCMCNGRRCTISTLNVPMSMPVHYGRWGAMRWDGVRVCMCMHLHVCSSFFAMCMYDITTIVAADTQSCAFQRWKSALSLVNGILERKASICPYYLYINCFCFSDNTHCTLHSNSNSNAKGSKKNALCVLLFSVKCTIRKCFSCTAIVCSQTHTQLGICFILEYLTIS